MKSVDVKSSTYIDFIKENNKIHPKFKLGDNARISKCTSLQKFQKSHEKVFVIKKIKSTVTRIYVISDLKGEGIVRIYYERELQKSNQKNLESKK